MKRLLLASALFFFSSPVLAAVVDGLAAVVDGRVITRTEVEELAAVGTKTGALPPGDRIAKALEALIEKALIEREAEKVGLQVLDEELEQTLESVRKRNGLDKDGFRAAVIAQGVDYDGYVSTLRAQILRAKVAGRALRPKLKIGDDALREFYLKNVAEFREPEAVHLYHVQVPSGNAAKADAVRARALAGEDFRALAKSVSGAPGAAEGGDMGFVPVKNLAPEVQDAIAGLPEGSVSRVVEMHGAFHLFSVAERRSGKVPTFEDMREQIRERFYKEKEDELYRGWIESLKEKVRIERKL